MTIFIGKLIRSVSVTILFGICFLNSVYAASLFEEVRDAIVLISAGESSGSGFIGSMHGKKYLFSNDHVLRGGRPLKAQLLSGRAIDTGAIEVAQDRDLVRVSLPDQNLFALHFSPAPIGIGDTVTVFGNSDGSGVCTAISGTVQGVGPKLLETDAPFVRGNSGSAIVDKTGQVVAVATYAVRHDDPNDWVKQGTRFAGTRRFGLNLNGIEWERISQDDYALRAEVLNDMAVFSVDFYMLRFTDAFRDPHTKLYDYQYGEQKARYTRSLGLCKLLSDATVTFNEALLKEREAERKRSEISAKRRAGMIGAESSAALSSMIAKKRWEEHEETYKRIYVKVSRMLKRNNWQVKRMSNEVDYWLKALRLITEKTQEEIDRDRDAH